MLVLSERMADDGLTNLNWLVEHNPMAPLSPSTPPTSPSPLPSSSSSVSSPPGQDYTRQRIKPPFSYAQLITMAMQACGTDKVLLTDIYSWIRDNFAYFRGNDTSWQNSVRHNLSLNKQFVKVPREPKDKGKGSYWKLDTANCNLTKDPYCLRRRNFTESGTSARRTNRPEVSHPQVNPAIKKFLERVRRLQEARRHPFAGTGEKVEDIGAQECVYTDTDPVYDDYNRKLFKKDVELYDPNGYCSTLGKEQKSVNLGNLTPLASPNHQQAKVRVEYNWEAYEYQPAGVQSPLEPETARLDLRIPTPDWWTSNVSASHNLLLSPSNANPMAKVFESMAGGVCTDTSPVTTTITVIGPGESVQGLISIPDQLDTAKCTAGQQRKISCPMQETASGIGEEWSRNRTMSQSETLLLDLDCGTTRARSGTN